LGKVRDIGALERQTAIVEPSSLDVRNQEQARFHVRDQEREKELLVTRTQHANLVHHDAS
jgi:hypothetical protein